MLDNGVLSYYKSQEDVDNGCKGSIKMNVCDIVGEYGLMLFKAASSGFCPIKRVVVKLLACDFNNQLTYMWILPQKI